MRTIRLTGVSLALLAISWLSSCKKQDLPASKEKETEEAATANFRNGSQGYAENDMVMYWNEKASIVMDSYLTNPPTQARYFAMVQIAVFDALNSVKHKYQTYALNNVKKKEANIDAAVAAAAYWTIKQLNIQGANPLDSWYEESLATIPDNAGKDAGKILGKQAADAIIANRNNDGFSLASTSPPLPDGVLPGAYRSTLPFSQPGFPKVKAISLWGTAMRPFSLQNSAQFRPGAPYAVNSPEYTQDYLEVKSKGGLSPNTRTPQESEIGVFWVERSSIGWNRFARKMIGSKKMDAWKTARVFALLHTAMADAATACFEAKYYYFYWRPETAVRLGDSDGNPNTPGDPLWLPSYTETPSPNPIATVYTPPIPDYPSAHAAFGGAASAVLAAVFGTNNISVDQTSNTLPGVTRHYSSFTQAARDNSLSRIYVGYHFRKAAMAGETQGMQVGAYVFQNSFQENDDSTD